MKSIVATKSIVVTKIIVVTGPFGSGKSAVAKMFGALGAKVISADSTVRALYRKISVKRVLKKKFGTKIFLRTGGVGRRVLARIVFSDKKLLLALEKIVHPLVFSELEKKLFALKKKRAGFVVVEIPVFFWSPVFFGPKSLFSPDAVVVVKCAQKQRLQRLAKKGFSESEVLARKRAGFPLAKQAAMADFVVDNSKSFALTKKQVKKIFARISFDDENKGGLSGDL